MPKPLDAHKSMLHLSQGMSQPGLASLAMLTAGAGTAAVPAEDWRAQGPHLHPDDQDAGCAGGLPQPARLHIPAPGWHHQARAATGVSCLLLHPMHTPTTYAASGVWAARHETWLSIKLASKG